MEQAELPLISLTAPIAELSVQLGNSFRKFGFALVCDHGIDPLLIAKGWQHTHDFFALPEDTKRAYFNEELAGARGYTPFGIEKAKGAKSHDLKEFWHIGRELPAGQLRASSMPPNIWPAKPGRFKEIFLELYAEFDRVGALILSAIARNLGLTSNWFDAGVSEGNSVLRLLHYPPVTDIKGGAIRAGAHEDINLITLLLGAEEAGLELLSRDGSWLSINPPPGSLVVNIGDMLQRLTNHILPSTTHRVRNPDAPRAKFSRYSMPFFLHLNSDFVFKTLPNCTSPSNHDRYPDSITADEYLQIRLREIGLKR